MILSKFAGKLDFSWATRFPKNGKRNFEFPKFSQDKAPNGSAVSLKKNLGHKNGST